jgi:hypothetical protein
MLRMERMHDLNPSLSEVQRTCGAAAGLMPPQFGEQQLEKRGRDNEVLKKSPPRLCQVARGGQVIPAPKAELQAHKAAFRELLPAPTR